MAEFVRFTLDDGSQVLFESAESDLVALHGGPPEVRDGGKLTARLQEVAEAAEEVAGSLRSEPPRGFRRLHLVRGRWSRGTWNELSVRVAGARSPHGRRGAARVPVGLAGDQGGRGQAGNRQCRDAAQMGPPGRGRRRNTARHEQ